MSHWTLTCSGCGRQLPGDKLASLCPDCSSPLVAHFMGAVPRSAISAVPSLWRYAAAMRNNGAMDFDDLLMVTAQLLESNDAVRTRWQTRFA